MPRKFTRIIAITSDAVAICEDGFRFPVQMDGEGAFVEADGVAIYLQTGPAVRYDPTDPTLAPLPAQSGGGNDRG